MRWLLFHLHFTAEEAKAYSTNCLFHTHVTVKCRAKAGIQMCWWQRPCVVHPAMLPACPSHQVYPSGKQGPFLGCHHVRHPGRGKRHRAGVHGPQCMCHVWLCDPRDCSPPGSSVLGIFQARLLEWVAISPLGDLSDPGSNLCLLCLLHSRWFLYQLNHRGEHGAQPNLFRQCQHSMEYCSAIRRDGVQILLTTGMNLENIVLIESS